MASPFSIFRRHQRVMIATLTILTMFAFVFIPLIMQVSGIGSRASSDPVVIRTTRYGTLSERQLYQQMQQHNLVLNFLERAMIDAYAPMLGANMHPEILRTRVAAMLENEFGPRTERSAGDRWLLMQRAKEMGIIISDESLESYLKSRTADRLQGKQWDEIFAGLRIGNARQAEQVVLNALRNELMAQRVMTMFQVGLAANTPGQRWEYYQRLNRRARVELIPLSVADFLAEVANPDPKTLQKFFDEHKNQAYHPESPTPGFREPYRATVEFFKADFEKFIDTQSIKDEEIEQYYQKNKEQYVRRELPKLEGETTPKTEQAKPETEAPKTPEAKRAEPDAMKAPEAKKPEPQQPQGGEKKADAAKPAEDKKPAESKPDAKKQSSSSGRSPFRLVAMQVEKEGAGAKPEAASSGGAKPAETKPATESTPAVKPEPESKADAKPAAEPKPEVKDYLPLEKVKDEIRRTLATQKANDKILAVLEPLRNQVKRYVAALARKDKAAPAPQSLDFDAMAKQNGLTFVRLEMVSRWDVQGQSIGQSHMVGSQTTFVEHVFAQPGLGRAAISEDAESNKYLFWKADERKEHVPELSEAGIEPRVVRAWKMIEARNRALTVAKDLQTKAEAAKGKSLKELVQGQAGRQVIEPPAFSWMTYGNVPAMFAQTPPRISHVDGVELPSEEFMHAVFSLPEGQVGIGMNQPQTYVYVVRVDAYTPVRAVLWESFLVDDFTKYAPVAYFEHQAIVQNWLKDAKEAAGFHWDREPDVRRDTDGRAPVEEPEPMQLPEF